MKTLFSLLNRGKQTPASFTKEDEAALLKQFMSAQPAPPKEEDPPKPSTFDALTPESIFESVGKADFTKFINADRAKAALGGDAEAFNDVLVTAIRGAVAQSVVATTNIMKTGFDEKLAAFQKDQTSAQQKSARDSSVLQAVTSADKMFQSPEGSLIASALADRLKIATPDATPEEITAATSEIFSNMYAGNTSGTNGEGANNGGLSSAEEAAMNA